MMKFSVLVFCFCCIIAIALAGCSSSSVIEKEETVAVTEVQTTMVALEKWEKNLLCSVYDTEAERNMIEAGTLYRHQEKTLNNIRKTMISLEEKYPSHKFEIKRIETDLFGVENEAVIFTADGLPTEYRGYLAEGNELRDNFYAFIVGDDYDNTIKNYIAENGLKVVAVKTDFSMALGTEVDENLTVESLFKTGHSVPRNTAVYINSENEESSQVLKKAKQVITELNIYGAFRIYAYESFEYGLDYETCESIRANNQSEVSHVSFQCGY